MKKAICTLIDDNSYIYWKTLFNSFLAKNQYFINNTNYEFILIKDKKNPLSQKYEEEIGNKISNVRFVTSEFRYKFEDIYKSKFSTWYSCCLLNKLEIFNLISQYASIIYLDGDMLVNKSIEELFDDNLLQYDILACKDYSFEYMKDNYKTIGDHALEKLQYTDINCGFFIVNNTENIINLNIYNELNNIFETDKSQFAQYYNKITGAEFGSFVDQDVLNYTFKKNNLMIKYLSPKYNSWDTLFNWGLFWIGEASIIHYISKPWANPAILEWAKYN